MGSKIQIPAIIDFSKVFFGVIAIANALGISKMLNAMASLAKCLNVKQCLGLFISIKIPNFMRVKLLALPAAYRAFAACSYVASLF